MSGGKQVTMGYEPAPAFDFSNCTRNVAMVKCGAPAPRLTSTGTTIVAATFKVNTLKFHRLKRFRRSEKRWFILACV